MGPEKAPIRPEKARFSRKDFCPIFSEILGLTPVCEPPFGFPQNNPPQNTIHPNKSTACATIFGIVCANCPPPLSYKLSRKDAERVCANCLCKLFLLGCFIGVGWLSLKKSSHLYCDTLAEVCCSVGWKHPVHHPFVWHARPIRITMLCRSIGVRYHWNTPKETDVVRKVACESDMRQIGS